MKRSSNMVFAQSLLPLAIAAISAQVAAEEAVELSNVVVSAAGYEQNINDAAASITVISADELQKKSYTDISDALRHVAGVRMNGGGVEQSVSIRGMAADYTLFLIDGRPVTGNAAFANNGAQAGNSVNFLPPIEAIERIEVIRGPASALYGSDAMGGVVNIITKRVRNELSGSVSTEYMLADKSNKVNEDGFQTNMSLNAPLIQDTLSLQLTGSFYSQDESNFVGGSDSAASDPEYKKKQYGTKFSWNLNERNLVTIGNSYSIQERTHNPGRSLEATTSKNAKLTSGNVNDKPVETIDGKEYVYWAGDAANQAGYYEVTSKDGATHYWDAKNTTSFQRSIRESYFLTHEGKYDSVLWSSYINYDKSNNPSRVNATTGNGIEYDFIVANTQATVFAGSHTLTAGLTHRYENLKDGATNGLNIPGIVATTDIVEMERYQNSVFLEDEWALTNDLRITLSGRYDDNEDFGGHFSPKAYAVYHINDNFTVRGGVTSGFTAPSLKQSATDYGSTSMGGTNIGNPNLKPETSFNKEVGISFDEPVSGIKSTLTVYQTDFDDKIQRSDYVCAKEVVPCVYNGISYDDGAGNKYGYKTYENIDKAEFYGVEWTFDQTVFDVLTYRLNYTYTDSEQKTGVNKGKPLNNVVKHLFNVALDWQATDKLVMWTQANYRSETTGNAQLSNSGGVTAGIIYPEYTIFDAGLAYRAKDNLTLKFGVYNIANKEITPDEDYSQVLDGRRYNFALTHKF